MPMPHNPESEWFGSQHVTPEEKTGLVRGVFDSVATRYDVMNDLMSGGLHRLWKDTFVRAVAPRPGLKYLDVAGGTGDIAFRIKKKIAQLQPESTETRITVCDLNEHMLAVGQDRAIDRGYLDLEWVTGNAESLPFPAETYDVYTIAFGLRNVTRIDAALTEACRVLRPGGRFYCLEFSQVRNPLLARAYDLYSEKIIPEIGARVAQDRDSYQYLVESIRKFPARTQLKLRMEQAGFKACQVRALSGGIVAIHSGMKK